MSSDKKTVLEMNLHHKFIWLVTSEPHKNISISLYDETFGFVMAWIGFEVDHFTIGIKRKHPLEYDYPATEHSLEQAKQKAISLLSDEWGKEIVTPATDGRKGV